MNKRIELSIIIVNFNTYQFLTKCLDSIYQCNFPLDKLEIIVVDNASSDESSDLIRRNYRRVKLVSNKKNKGFAAASNQGIKIADGNYILLLNPDTLVFPETLNVMYKYMEEHPGVAVATCKVVLAEGVLDDACHRGFPTPWNAFCQFSGLSLLLPDSRLFNGYHLGYQNMDEIHEIDSCTGAFMFIRKRVGELAGWLDEDYFWYGEDLDFCFKVKKQGGKVMYVPETKIIHYKGISSGIKKHSQNKSLADKRTQILATHARFQVMRIFYQKHYQGKYPDWLTRIVFAGIRIKEYFSLIKYK